MVATATNPPARSGLEWFVAMRVGHFDFVAAGIHRSPAGAIGKPASAYDVNTAFYVVHLRFVERGNQALYFEIGKCNFFLCHTISEVSCEQIKLSSQRYPKDNYTASRYIYQVFGKVRFLRAVIRLMKGSVFHLFGQR